MEPEIIFSAVVSKVGSMTALARALDLPLTTVSNWRTRGFPADRCKTIEAMTGISVKHLRPHDWAKYWPETSRRSKAVA